MASRTNPTTANLSARASAPTSIVSSPAPALPSSDDTLAATRAMPVPPAESIPKPQAGYRATDPDIRFRELRKLAGDLEAVALDGAGDIVRNGDHMQGDFGKLAPDPEEARRVCERVEFCAASLRRTRILLSFLEEKQAINHSDLVLILEKTWIQYQHFSRFDSTMADRYANLIRFFKARGQMVSDGIARRREVEDLIAEAVKAHHGNGNGVANGNGNGVPAGADPVAAGEPPTTGNGNGATRSK